MTEIVGILNITPDSFSDGGTYSDPPRALERAHELFEQGADMIDIGAESTRPGADSVAIDDEWRRLAPVLNAVSDVFSPEQFMIDTRHGEIARRAIESWSHDLTLNDVTGLSDPEMARTAAQYGARIILGHLPAEAHGDIKRAHTVRMTDPWKVKHELHGRAQNVQQEGIDWRNIVLDPGIGFGKNPHLNRQLVEFAGITNWPVMIGYSRKRFLGSGRLDPAENIEQGERAVKSGAAYLRVHDVREHRQLLRTIFKRSCLRLYEG